MFGTIIIGTLLLAAFVIAVRSLIKTRKKGGCGCGCSGCTSKCNAANTEAH